MRSKNSWNKEYETKVDKNGKKHTRMVKHGMKQSKKSLAFSKHVNKMKTDKDLLLIQALAVSLFALQGLLTKKKLRR